uniref:Reverse transcriptase n=1 Tax=Quercus lobata TaxID=97700 RepID=A0A7N2MQC3_QUELO
MFRLCKKIKQANLELKQWNRSCFGNAQSKIKEAWKNLDQIQSLDPNPQNLEKEANLCLEIQELLKMEEILWHQKSRIKSLTSSNLKTRFFYLSTVIKWRRNSIDFMKKENGEWISGWEEIGQCFQTFFNNMFSSSTPNIPYDLNNLIPRCITPEDNEMLLVMPSMEEIKTTVFSMDSHKAPRLDGMSPLFFEHYWHLIGGDVVDAVLSFFGGDSVKPDKVVLAVVCRDSNGSIVVAQSQEECPSESLYGQNLKQLS